MKISPIVIHSISLGMHVPFTIRSNVFSSPLRILEMSVNFTCTNHPDQAERILYEELLNLERNLNIITNTPELTNSFTPSKYSALPTQTVEVLVDWDKDNYLPLVQKEFESYVKETLEVTLSDVEIISINSTVL